MADVVSGRWMQSQTRFGTLVHALLHPGEENSGKLVSTIRQQAIMVAGEQSADWILVDGSPGIGCPVIAAVTGVDLALLVAEPTISGVHDLRRILGVTEHFGVTSAVCINKCDINPRLAHDISAFCADTSIPFLGQIGYDAAVLQAMRRAVAVTEMSDNAVSREIGRLWQSLREFAPAS
jgi:MinD superfamily P-loop ATPase